MPLDEGMRAATLCSAASCFALASSSEGRAAAEVALSGDDAASCGEVAEGVDEAVVVAEATLLELASAHADINSAAVKNAALVATGAPRQKRACQCACDEPLQPVPIEMPLPFAAASSTLRCCLTMSPPVAGTRVSGVGHVMVRCTDAGFKRLTRDARLLT
ncbi:hypothetical protein LFL96_13585 [Paraburkholderia sp. D15]|uniref:hypothetical protein n=1 Tax=Paraburkholderia sp. D15 TaxID=2880218 RepID=UPI00247A7A56|nr:hypothetical protein [Paraburkholderia sp. D15]WGS48805.1 hypothetical protein LFL96_13585 [Paraburkholderia sp. D15]